jgi:hypothetical protein
MSFMSFTHRYGNKITEAEMGETAAFVEEMRKAYAVLIEKPEGKRQLGRPKHQWIILK